MGLIVYGITLTVSSFSNGVSIQNVSILNQNESTVRIPIPIYTNVSSSIVTIKPFRVVNKSISSLNKSLDMLFEFEKNMLDSSGNDKHMTSVSGVNYNNSDNIQGKYFLYSNSTGGSAQWPYFKALTETNFTFAFWIRMLNITKPTISIFQMNKGSGIELDFVTFNDSIGHIRVNPAGGSTTTVLRSNNFSYLDRWVHVAYSHNSNDLNYSIYINGIFHRNGTGGLNDNAGTNVLDGADVYYMDDFRIYNITLTNEDIFNLSQILFVENASLKINNIPQWNQPIAYSPINLTLNSSDINNILIDGCNCTECIVNEGNCEVPLTLSSGTDSTFELSGINISYFFGIDNCTSFSTVALNISFREMANDNLIKIDYKNTLDILLETGSIGNFSVSADNINFTQLCIFPSHATHHANMLIQYTNGSTLFEYSTFNTTLDNVTDLLNLYVTGGTSQVVLTVTDLDDDPVSGALISVLKYDVGTGTYRTTEILETDGNGQTVANIVLIDAFYRFIISTDGVVRLIEPETGGVRVLTTTKNFRIDLEGALWFDNFDTTLGVATSLTYNDATQSFTYTWADPNSNMHQGCLKVVKTNRTRETVLSDTCVTSAASTIVQSISAVQNGSNFIATGYLRFEDIIVTDTLVKEFAELFTFSGVGDKRESLFAGMILIGGLGLIGVPFPAVGMLLMALGIIVSFILKIYLIGYGLVVAIIVLFIIQIYKMRS